jgi:hypothetical protein
VSRNIFETAKRTDSLLRSLTLGAHSTLADIEHEVASDLVTETLQSMGYHLIRTKGNSLIGTSEETGIRAKVLSGGNILLDTTSFSGLSCQKEIVKFENKLKEKGVVLKRLLNADTKRTDGVLLKDPFPAFEKKEDFAGVNLTKPRSVKRGLNEQQYYCLMNRNLQRQNQRIKEA